MSTAWQPIETAPTDGTVVDVICGRLEYRWPTLQFRSRYVDGRWCALFGREWKSYQPGPSYWRPAVETPGK